MEEKSEGLLERLYRALYLRVGGCPWTQIIRDSHRRHPLLWLPAFGAVGILLGHLFW